MNNIYKYDNKIEKYFLIIFPYFFIISVWLYFAIIHPLPFWQEIGDYPWDALSQAFTLESKFAGHNASNFNYHIHPGIPFAFASWVAFRLATIGLHNSGERITYVISNPENFWFWAKTIALGLNLLGVFLIQCMYRKNLALFFLSTVVYFSAVPAAYGISLLQLSNESFALIQITLFYFLTYLFLKHSLNSRSESDTKSISISNPYILSVLLGALSAIGWSIKIYYLAPSIGLFLGVMTSLVLGLCDKKIAFRGIIFFLSSFLVVATFIIFFIMGWSAFTNWVNWNWEMISHVKRYGNGEKGFMRLSLAQSAIESLSYTTKGTFPLVFLSVVGTFFFTFFRSYKNKSFFIENFPFFIAILSGITINFIGLIKHYSPLSQHYALPIVASLIPMFLIVQRGDFNRQVFLIGNSISLILLLLNLTDYTAIQNGSFQFAEASIRDSNLIDTLPIHRNERRVWGYFTPINAGIIPMVNQYAGSSFVTQIIKSSCNPIDITPNIEPDTKRWRYIIFPKTYYPTRESIFKNFPKMFDFSITKFIPNKSDRITEMETLFLLTRNMDVHQNIDMSRTFNMGSYGNSRRKIGCKRINFKTQNPK